jgi:hypothetical protein
MFAVKNGSINKGKWYVAHIFPVKADRRFASEMTPEERVARFIRNVHPANHFYFPCPARGVGRHYGEHRQVIDHIMALYRVRYATLWQDFLAMAIAQDSDPAFRANENFPIAFPLEDEHARFDRTAISSGKGQPIMSLQDKRSECRHISIEELSPNFMKWTGNDSSNRQYHNRVPFDRKPCDIRLKWKSSKDSEAQLIGHFRLNLVVLLERGYARREPNFDGVRLRFVHHSDNFIYIQANSQGEKLQVGRFI